jgi:hypothetical protein
MRKREEEKQLVIRYHPASVKIAGFFQQLILQDLLCIIRNLSGALKRGHNNGHYSRTETLALYT